MLRPFDFPPKRGVSSLSLSITENDASDGEEEETKTKHLNDGKMSTDSGGISLSLLGWIFLLFLRREREIGSAAATRGARSAWRGRTTQMQGKEGRKEGAQGWQLLSQPYRSMPCYAMLCRATHSLESSPMSRLDTARVPRQHKMMRTHTTDYFLPEQRLDPIRVVTVPNE